jgi:(2Fe-2S) ferredoxin
MVIYPEGVWYHHVDRAKLDQISEEHLKGGRPVEEYMFHRMGGEDGTVTGAHFS